MSFRYHPGEGWPGLSRKDAPVRLQERAGRHAYPPAALAFGHSTLGTTYLTKLCVPSARPAGLNSSLLATHNSPAA